MTAIRLSSLLLTGDIANEAKRLIDVYLAFRESVPQPGTDFQMQAKRGENVFIEGFSEVPDFFVERIELDGEGRIAGSNFSFSGEARNISLRPEAQKDPTTFHLRAQGKNHVLLDCVLDRSGGRRNDQVNVVCPGLEIARRQIGSEDTLLVGVSPSRASVKLNLNCDDDQLTGDIELDYDNLVMQIEKLDERAGGSQLADRVNLELAAISNYQVKAVISGSLYQPLVKFETDLGQQFASKLNPLLRGENSFVSTELDNKLRKYLDKLDSLYGEKVRLLSVQLEKEVIGREKAVVAELEKKLEQTRLDIIRR